ncbi:MAG TPA: zinc ribbon domain-containing protein [Longimicrobiales bacterium]|nr:zinc ribbon domain-containing protein [Longimicrobiales bacterium]
MPLYEYSCTTCGTRFEAMRRMSERASAPACPGCGGEDTALAMSRPAVHGTGGGGGASCGTNAWTGGG